MPFSNAVFAPRRFWLWPCAAIWAGIAACIIGLLATPVLEALSRSRIHETATLAALAWLLAWPISRLLHCRMATAIAAFWLTALAFFAGPSAILATALLAACGWALGDLLSPKAVPARAAIATAIGLAAIAGALGWLLPLPMFRWYFLLPAMLGLLAWRWRDLSVQCRETAHGWRETIAAAPRSAAFAALVLGLASTGAWLPTMQPDDLGYHLGLPSQLLVDDAYRPDPAHQVWALAPWLGDVLQGIVQVMSRGEGRGALNALWLAMSASALWACGAGLGQDAKRCWLTVALFASLPMLPALAAGMQTELPAIAFTSALAALIAHRAPGSLWAGAALFGALLGLKLSHAAAALPLLLYACWRWRGSVPWKRIPSALLLTIAVGGASYAYAAAIAGNPVLPLFNAMFGSPYFPLHDFDDARWHAGFSPGLIWDITFDTDRYIEAYDGAFGFAAVALAGAWLLAVLRRETRAYALTASLVLLLPLAAIQYARYATPGLVLLLPALASALPARLAAWTIPALCALQLAFHTHGSWLLYSGSVKKIVKSKGEEAALFDVYAPERNLIALARKSDPRGIVLATDPARPYVAEAGRLGRSVNWYDPALAARRTAAESERGGNGWRNLFAQTRTRWAIVDSAQASGPLREGLALAGAERVGAAGDMELWRLQPEPDR